MKAGDTFTLKDKAVDSHLWVILSDPAIDEDRVLFVSMTSYDITKENVCLLDVGDHPSIKHKTCIAYDFAKAAPLKNLISLRDQGLLSMANRSRPDSSSASGKAISLSQTDQRRPPQSVDRPRAPGLMPPRARLRHAERACYFNLPRR